MADSALVAKITEVLNRGDPTQVCAEAVTEALALLYGFLRTGATARCN